MRALIGLTLAVAALGCGTPDPCQGVSGVCVTAVVQGNARGLDQLAITIDSPTVQTKTTPSTPSALALPVQLFLRLPGPGTVKISVAGLTRGTAVAFDQKTVTVTSRARVTFTLNTGTAPDLGMAVADMAEADLTEPPDMTELDLACAPGTQDNDDDGTCLPDCKNAGLDCTVRPHMECSDRSGTATCICVAGYEVSGSDCVWGTLPLDPGFQDTPMGAWTVERGAMVRPTAGGNIEAGDLFFDKNTICSSHGRARQTIQMPPYPSAEPLALKVASHQDCLTTGMPFPCFYGGVDVNINGAGSFFKLNTVSTIENVCLGERAFGGPVELVVRPWTTDACAQSASYSLYVDHVSIVRDPTCSPAPSIPNGDMEGTSNWTFLTSGSGPPVGAIEAGVGAGGTRGAHFGQTKQCDNATLVGKMSVPLAMPNLAIQFEVRGSELTSMPPLRNRSTNDLTFGMVRNPSIVPYSTAKVCVGEYAKGMVVPLSFGPVTYDCCGCASATVQNWQWWIDNVQFVSDPSCPAVAGIPDPGFERTDIGSNWHILPQYRTYPAELDAVIDATMANAHSGMRSLKMIQQKDCGRTEASTIITVPAPTATDGPALKFWYKLPTVTNAAFTVNVGGVATNLSAAANYAEKTVCLDPSQVGHPVQLMFVSADTGGGGCGLANYPVAEIMWVDDVSVTTDATCPTN